MLVVCMVYEWVYLVIEVGWVDVLEVWSVEYEEVFVGLVWVFEEVLCVMIFEVWYFVVLSFCEVDFCSDMDLEVFVREFVEFVVSCVEDF